MDWNTLTSRTDRYAELVSKPDLPNDLRIWVRLAFDNDLATTHEEFIEIHNEWNRRRLKLPEPWRIDYDNDSGPGDEGFECWWDVTNGERNFRCRREEDAKWLLEILVGVQEMIAQGKSIGVVK